MIMKSIQHFSLALLAVTVLACAACGQDRNPAPAGPASTTPAASQTPSGTAETPIPTDYEFRQMPGPQAPEMEVPQPGASWSAAAEKDALVTATQAMAAFANPMAGGPKWFEDLKPYLTPETAESFSYTDPHNVPVRAVKGPGTLIKDAANPFGAVVQFFTDAGMYSVQVVRIGDGAPWQVAAIAPTGNK